jgi:DnaJ-class molecular chaperone
MPSGIQDNAGATAPGESNLNPGDQAPPDAPGTGENVCPQCNGKGKLESGSPCPNCGGSGKVITGIAGG